MVPCDDVTSKPLNTKYGGLSVGGARIGEKLEYQMNYSSVSSVELVRRLKNF